MRIVTVLKTGGDFRVEHFAALRKQIDQFAPGVASICLTDDHEALQLRGTKRLRHDWPGWWSKMEIFRIPGPVLYMDLDTVVVDDLSPLLMVAKSTVFTVLRDFNPQQRVMGSGLMAWADGLGNLYETFRDDPDRYMKACTSGRWFGDQGFIEQTTKAFQTPLTFWQDMAPRAVVSFKKHCADGVPAGARVVCFHGKPRPWEARFGPWRSSDAGPKK